MEKLKDQGWYLTEEGLKKLPPDLDKSDSKKIIQAALDIDFRDIANGALSSDISRKDETIAGKIVLQILKIRNISAPKANEESKTAPRFLQIDFTDGVNQIQGLEMEPIAAISLNTPPGTKIYFKNDKIPLIQGIMMLKSNDIQVLGGKVLALYDKWEMSRTLLKYAKGGRTMGGSSGPPPWIPFGEKIQQNFGISDKNFKSLGASGIGADKDKESKENNEFDAMRNVAIAEAAKVGGKKVFGGGNQQIVDYNVKKILEKGYSEEDAKNALKSTRNNLERALYNLKRRDEHKNSRSDDYRGGSEKNSRLNAISSGNSGKGGSYGKGNSRDNFSNRKSAGGKDDLSAPAKPAGNVSLFDFLTDKLPANASEPTVPIKSTTTNSNPSSSRYESSSNSRQDRSSRSNNYDYASSSKPYNKHNNSHNQNTHYSDARNQNNSSSSHHQFTNIPNNQSNNSRSTATSGFSNSLNTGSGSAAGAGKFENNISSSFQAATNNRNTQDDRNNSNRNSSRGGRNSYRGGGSGVNSSDRQQNADNSENYNRDRDNQRNNNNSNYGQHGNRNQKPNDHRESERNERASSYQGSNPSHYKENNNNQTENSSGARGGSYDNSRNNRNNNDNSHQSHNRNNGYENSRGGGGQHNSSGRGGHVQSSSSRYQMKETSSNAYQQNNQQTQHQYQQSNNSRNYNTNDNTRHTGSSSYHLPQQQQNSASNSTGDLSNKVNKLIDETTKLKLDEKTSRQSISQQHQQSQPRNQHNSQVQQQQQQLPLPLPQQQQIVTMVSHHQQPPPMQQQQQQQPPALCQQQQQQQQQSHSLIHQQQQNALLLPNGFTYNPNKIMGFQNKETNEFAMTLLKSQGIPTALAAAAAATGRPQLQMSHHPGQQPQPFATSRTYVIQQTIPPQSQSIVHQQQANHHVANPVHQVQHHQQLPPPPASFGMNSRESWNWKIGDRCMAKYWDDGRYYEAEITGISEKTCVVFYLGYGNHEEVLRTDCLPITDAQNRVINFASTPAVTQSPMPSGALSRGVPNRFRGERQMYVPPPKREV